MPDGWSGAVRRDKTAMGVFLAVAALVGAYHLGRARADGVPTVTPLFYGGMLEDNGRPVEGRRDLTIRLWDAATGGATACTTAVVNVEFAAGRFRVPLDASCAGAVRSNPNLWAEVQIGGTTFPRSKLGAVPYALEAGRASGAAGALETRLAALEAGGMGGGTVAIFPRWEARDGGSEIIPIECPVDAAPPGFFVDIPTLRRDFVADREYYIGATYRVATAYFPLSGDAGVQFAEVYAQLSPAPESMATWTTPFSTSQRIWRLRVGATYRMTFEVRLTSQSTADACRASRSSYMQVARSWVIWGI